MLDRCRLVLALSLGLTITASCARRVALPGEGDDSGKTVVYRDTWGVAHIYAPDPVAGLYAMGYAVAEDRPDQLLRNFAIAIGEYASVVGEAAVPSDLRSHMWQHYEIGQRRFAELPTELRRHIEAYVRGINDFYAAHPADVPEWWGQRSVDTGMVLAFSRLFLYNWSIDEAYEDLERGGVEPGFERASRGSNQFVVAPSRSAEGSAILAIDPHLAWEGPSRFWEFRIHAGELEGSGVTLPGSPYIGLGHNRYVAWAMTTGGPDTADVYELTLMKGDSSRYLYDGEWREFSKKDVTLEVRDGEPQTHTLWFSHHGPIVAIRGTKAYAAKTAYGDSLSLEAWHHFNFARDYRGVVDGLATLTVFPQNVMVADTSGNIYYQRTGRVPRRPEGFDWSVPVNGSTSATEWLGFHPAEDHLQILNPEQGYMQNCNIPPDAMMKNSPFQPTDYPDYLFSGPGYGPTRSGWTNQRGARAVQLLDSDNSVTAAEARAYINDRHPFGAERWIEALRKADEEFGAAHAEHPGYRLAMDDLLAWDLELSRASTGALKFAMWRDQLNTDLGAEMVRISGGIDAMYSVVTSDPAPPIVVLDDDLAKILNSFVAAMDLLTQEYGKLEATYGDRYRVGRGERSWGAGGGGGRNGTTTLRNVGYGKEREDHTRWGQSGQTSTQVVVLSTPPQSWMYIPLGESDRPESPHYSDQAEKIFSRAELKETWWLPENLAGHIESRSVLEKAPAGSP